MPQGGSRAERLKAEEYEHSAQLVRIMGRGNYSLVNVHQLHNFVWRHEAYLHPRCVLERGSTVTLMGATPEHVFFCVTNPGVDVCDTKVNMAWT